MSEANTVWMPQYNQEGEYAPSDSSNIDTESGVDLLAEDGTNIIIEDSTFTQIPATVYTYEPGS